MDHLTDRDRTFTDGTADLAAFNQLFANNPVPMWIYDRESLRFLQVNQAALNMMGYSRDEFLSMGLESIRPPEDVPALKALLRLERPSLRASGEWRHVYKDGTIHNVLVHSQIIQFGGRSASLVMVQDITESRSAQRALEESEQRYRCLFDYNSDAVGMLDLTGRFQSVNPAATALSGYSSKELIGSTFNFLLESQDAVKAKAELDLRSPKPNEFDFVLIRKDGGRVNIHVTAIPIVLDGEMAGVFVVVRDTTARIRAHDENRALMAQVHAERERLENLLARVPGVVWEFWDEPDPAGGRVNYVSAHVETMLGYPASNWLDDPRFWLSVVHPADRESAQASAWEAYSHGGGTSRYRCFTADGRLLWIESRSVPICDAGGMRVGMRGVNMDITEQVRAEEAVRLSEERYRLVQRATQDAIWDADLLTGQVVHNDSLCSVYRYTPEQVGTDQQWWYDHIHPDDREAMMRGIQQAVESGGEYWAGHHRFLRGDGTWANVLDRAYISRDADGTPVRVLGAMTDLTETRRMQETLRFLAQASEALGESLDYQATLSNLVRVALPTLADYATIDIFEPDGRVSRVAAAHIVPERECTLLDMARRYYASSRPKHPRLDALRRGEEQMMQTLTAADYRLAAEDDDHLAMFTALNPTSYIGVPLFVQGKPFAGMSFVFADSGRHHTEDDLNLARELARRASTAVENARLYREIQRADVAKDQFLAMLSHELRNPLGGILNAMQLIHLRGKVDPAMQRTLEVVERQTRHMARLVDDLLDVSRITQGKVELRVEATTVQEIVEQAVQGAQPLLDARDHVLSVHMPDEPLWLEADPIRLTQVISNLLSNAAKYTEPGGRITLSAVHEGADAVVRVQDTGVGISPEMLPRVFDLFAQAERSLDRSQGGLGIGLTVVRNMVEMHGGSVSAESDGPGRGSLFTVRLPALSEPPPSRTQPPAGRPTNARRLRVLLVEDNVDAARTLGEILGMWGHEVRLVHDGLTALDVASAFSADVVLLDIGLPSMDGYEVCRRLRSDRILPDATLVALTGYGQEDDHRRSREAGFDHHLVKPVDFGALESLLNTLGQG